MKIAIENFGAIKQRIEIEPKPLTIFCGSNNTGKTYALYVLNALMDSRFIPNFDISKNIWQELNDKGHCALLEQDWLSLKARQAAEKNIADELKKSLIQYFVADESMLESTLFGVTLDEMAIHEIVDGQQRTERGSLYKSEYGIEFDGNVELKVSFSEQNGSLTWTLKGRLPDQLIKKKINTLLFDLYCPERLGRFFLLPAERSGINLFFRELNSKRAALFRHVTSQTLDTNELLKDIIVSRYPQPIHDYIEFMNAQPEIKRQTSEQFADMAAWLQKEVLRVKYKVDRYGDISIAPLRSKTELGLHLGSSTAKTFFGLWSYLNHLAQPGDCLMIDEPELNLHPLNQRNIARLLAELVNRGIRVVVSTHSDYMVREWGNLVMLSEDFPERDAIAKRHGLSRTQWLAADKVHAYEFHAGGVNPMAVNAGSGIRTPLFDESIEELNAAAQDIYFAVQAARPLEQEPPEQKTGKARKGKA